MTREEFIFHSINKVYKPIFYLILFLLGLNFLTNAYKNESGIERSFIYAGLFVIGLILILGILTFLFNTIWQGTPDKIKAFIHKASNVLSYILIPFAIYICYIRWENNKWSIIGFAVIFLLTNFNKLFKQTKPI
jgi:hypothetical protein